MISEAPATGVIVVAAGSGSRLGRDRPKAFVAVAGRSILARSLDAVFALSSPVQVVVVVPAAMLAEAETIAAAAAGPAVDHISVVAGGASRQASVAAGLAALDPAMRTVLVHDAARAFAPVTLFESVLAAVAESGAGVIPALPVTDTIKRTDAASGALETVDRSELVAVQTPQGFPLAQLAAAYAAATREFTDDAALFAAAGHEVRVVAGDAAAFKITTPWDLRRAESLLGPQLLRTGIGIDVHGFDAHSPLWLGSLHWPGQPGLSGHSDGDVVSHAICDAMLSAAGLGDIGTHFGTSEPRYADAAGEVFLLATLELVGAAGFTISNVAVQILANAPKISPRRREMEALLSGLLDAPVSISSTTTDGLGFVGRGEGITAVATALLIGR